MAFVEQSLGPAHRVVGARHIWEYPRDAEQPTTRLKVSGLRFNDARGRSAIKLHHPGVSGIYRGELVAHRCVRRP